MNTSLSLLLSAELLEDIPLVSVCAPGVAQPGVSVGAGGAGGKVPHHVLISLGVGQGTLVGRLASLRHLLESLLSDWLGSWAEFYLTGLLSHCQAGKVSSSLMGVGSVIQRRAWVAVTK